MGKEEKRKDGWKLMEWVKLHNWASSHTPSCSILLLIPLCSVLHSFVLPSTKALIGSEILAQPRPEEVWFCVS